MIAIIFAILIALIDTGIELNHPAFGDTNVTAVSMLLGDTSDNCDHGTGVASIVAQHAPYTDILMVKVGAPCNASSTAIARGIRYAVNQGADIISIQYSSPWNSYEYEESIGYALAHDVIVVASAGNRGSNAPEYPAALDGVISVGCNPDEFSYTSYGNWVDVVAPCSFNVALSGGNQYEIRDGTSYAAPYWAAILGRNVTLLPIISGKENGEQPIAYNRQQYR